MFGLDFAPGLILGLREGLEAFLIIAIMLEYLNKIHRPEHKKDVYIGLALGIVASLLFGLILFGISDLIGANSDNLAKLWEFFASFLALLLITTFIIYMIRHNSQITQEIRNKMDLNISKKSIILLALIMVAREGAEVTLFAFASTNETMYLTGALFGIILAGILTFLIYKSLLKVNLKILFRITLLYLILQAGFMIGYSFHELFSYFKAESIIQASHPIYTKLFDLSNTFLDHKTGIIGIPLYILMGWYSKPEVFQFIVQYVYTGTLLYYFFVSMKKQ
jgi:high-affinity iron transporter